jgi:hypothetical protein
LLDIILIVAVCLHSIAQPSVERIAGPLVLTCQ